MRLTSSQLERTLTQLEAQAIPDNHPSAVELNRVFGEHTFFLDESGLHIVEPAESNEDGTEAGQVIKLASWQDAGRTRLAAHDPEPSDTIVELGSDGAERPN